MGGEAPNTMAPIEGRVKFDRVRAAAIIAVMPVCGQEEGGLASAPAVVTALNDYYAQQGRSAPGWVDNLAQGRLNYAAAHTEVTLMTVVDGGAGPQFEEIVGGIEVGAKDAIAVEVRRGHARVLAALPAPAPGHGGGWRAAAQPPRFSAPPLGAARPPARGS